MIELSFDRLLHPATTVRQSFVLRTANGDVATSPVVTYDPIARKITLSNPDPDPSKKDWLVADQSYLVTLGIPQGDAVGSGVRAIDGATLDPAATDQRTIGFRVCKAGAPCQSLPFKPPQPISFCNDIQPVFQNKCSAAQCHGAPTPGSKKLPAAGLILETSLGLQKTAVNHVAQGANTGALAGVASSPDRVFGINMPIIDPGIGSGGNPANSWLIYKALLAVPPTTSPPSLRLQCDTAKTPPAPTPVFDPKGPAPFAPLSEGERAILSDYVLGREMPYPSKPGDPLGSPTDNPALTLEELERLELWIAAGAIVDECGACQK